MKEKIQEVVSKYFKVHEIEDLMEYGADKDAEFMPTMTDMYKEILDRVDVKYKSIYTEDYSDGKYTTTIQFENDTELLIDTKAWSGEDLISDNVNQIYLEYQSVLENDMEM